MSDETAITITKTELTDLEKRVRVGLASFLDVGLALKAIKERNGFRLRGFEDFNAYCEKTFQFSERNGYRLIAAAETAQSVKKQIGETPKNEASARVLKDVVNVPGLLQKVKERLAKKGASISTATAEAIGEVVDQVRPKTAPMFPGKDKPADETQARMPTLNDVCPKCKTVPALYSHSPDGWHCGRCNTLVLIGVMSATARACPTCGAAIVGEQEFCTTCGGAL